MEIEISIYQFQNLVYYASLYAMKGTKPSIRFLWKNEEMKEKYKHWIFYFFPQFLYEMEIDSSSSFSPLTLKHFIQQRIKIENTSQTKQETTLLLLIHSTTNPSDVQKVIEQFHINYQIVLLGEKDVEIDCKYHSIRDLRIYEYEKNMTVSYFQKIKQFLQISKFSYSWNDNLLSILQYIYTPRFMIKKQYENDLTESTLFIQDKEIDIMNYRMEQFYEDTKRKFDFVKMYETKKKHEIIPLPEKKKEIIKNGEIKKIEKKIDISLELEYFISLHEKQFFLFLYVSFQYPNFIEKVYISRNEMEEIEKSQPFYFQYMKLLLFSLKKRMSVNWIPDEHMIPEFPFHQIIDKIQFSWNPSFFDFMQISLFEKESIDFILLYPNIDETFDLQKLSNSKKYIFLPNQSKNSIFHYMNKNYDIFDTSLYIDYRDFMHTNYKQFLEYEINLFHSCEKIIGYKRKEEIQSFFHFFFLDKFDDLGKMK
jgi:hypothetical protein